MLCWYDWLADNTVDTILVASERSSFPQQVSYSWFSESEDWGRQSLRFHVEMLSDGCNGGLDRTCSSTRGDWDLLAVWLIPLKDILHLIHRKCVINPSNFRKFKSSLFKEEVLNLFALQLNFFPCHLSFLVVPGNFKLSICALASWIGWVSTSLR